MTDNCKVCQELTHVYAGGFCVDCLEWRINELMAENKVLLKALKPVAKHLGVTTRELSVAAKQACVESPSDDESRAPTTFAVTCPTCKGEGFIEHEGTRP